MGGDTAQLPAAYTGRAHDTSGWEMAQYWRAVATARDWVGTSQPWNRFVGWQGWGAGSEDGTIPTGMASLPASWSVPTAPELGPRISQNLSHYLTNCASCVRA